MEFLRKPTQNESLLSILGILSGRLDSQNLSRETYQQAVDKENANFQQLLRKQIGATRELVAAAIVTMAAVSLIGNGLVCCVFHRRRNLRTVTNIFLLNLSIAQMFLACTAVPINLTKMFYIDWQLGGVVCSLAYFINTLCTGASSFTLVCIAVDRHRVIVTPMRPRLSRSAVFRMLLASWLAAAAMAAAAAAWPAEGTLAASQSADDSKGHVGVYLNRRSSVCAFMSHQRSRAVRLAFKCIAFGLQYLLPLVIITVAYTRIIHTLWIAKKSFEPGGRAGVDSGVTGSRHVARRRTIVMLALVVCLFFISWSPIHLFVISSGWRQVDRGDLELLLHGVCYWIAMSNIWYNPIIYVWFNSKFRKALSQIVCGDGSGCCGGRCPSIESRQPQLELGVAAAVVVAAAASMSPQGPPVRDGSAINEDFRLTDTTETNRGVEHRL